RRPDRRQVRRPDRPRAHPGHRRPAPPAGARRRVGGALSSAADSLLDRRRRLAIELLALLGLALVVELLALGQGDLDLDPVALEIDRQRHHGVSLEEGAAEEALDLAPLQQQAARALGQVVLAVAVAVRTDVGADQERLPVAELDEAVLQ